MPRRDVQEEDRLGPDAVEQDDGSVVTKRIPLDVSAPVYRVIKEDASGDPIVRRERDCYVSHFSTCKDAAQFSGKRKS